MSTLICVTAIAKGNYIPPLGTLNLRVPQTRDGSFCTEIFKRYQRNKQAFIVALMDMYVRGMSTRKVTKITKELFGVSFSKSMVSQLCVG